MFSGAFLFRKAKIQKAIKQERWEKMDYQMFKEQLAALLKRKAGDDFEVKVESVQKLNGIEKEAFVISRKKDWIAPTIYVELLYECCLQGVPLSQIAEKVLEQYRKVEAEARRPEKAAFFTNWKNAAPQIYCELIHAEKNRTLLSEVPHRKFLDLAVVYYYQMRGNRVPDATILIHETHRELWGISAEELDAVPGRTPAGSAGAHRQPYGVFERGVRSNVSPVRAWSAGGTVLPGQQPQRKAGCNLHVLSRRAGESFAAL